MIDLRPSSVGSATCSNIAHCPPEVTRPDPAGQPPIPTAAPTRSTWHGHSATTSPIPAGTPRRTGWRSFRGEATPEWSNRCFDSGTFHYLFNHVHARRAAPHPDALAHTALAQFRSEAFPWARFAGFAEVDVIYCLHRAGRSFPVWTDAEAALRDFASRDAAFATQLDLEDPRGAGDLHLLFGVVCALAELQLALPDAFVTDHPLRLVLDRRPFI